MADLVSPIVDIISRLWSCSARQAKYLCELQENKDLLRNAIAELKEARDDVQRRVIEAEADPNEPKKRTNPVSGWLQRVETIDGEVEVILQKADEQLSRARCLGGCCPPNNCWSYYKVGKSIAKKMIPLVKELKVDGKFEEVTYRLPLPPVQPMNLESTVGMESMFDKVWGLITSKDHKVSIMGLYGIGGVGKTTLLEKINNEFSNKISTGEHGFDYVVIFVVVSQSVNYEAIQNKIGERLGLSLQGDESSRAEKIFKALSNKNYVLLLDDIWEDQSGDQFFDKKRIGIPIHPRGGNSSKLIFTTRSERVCGLMEATHTFQVECLPWDKAWSLFQDKVGEKVINYLSEGGAPELAKDVAKECGGLPLALITIGRAMSTKKSVQEWRDAIKTLRRYASEFKDMRDKVLPRLKLSYDNLSDETEKSCFCYCALFPEDHSIKIAKLVEYWIAEGFLDRDNNLDEARDRGHSIIGSLKSACLLEGNGKDHVKMHDVIRDLALWIVNDCSNTTGKFLVASNSNVCETWRNAERIFWMIDEKDLVISEDLPKSPNLRTLLVHPVYIKNFSLPQSFFQFTPSLRVLDMSDIPLAELPTSICQLSDLQYLNLPSTRIKELPTSICQLSDLQYLNLPSTRIKELPIELRNLVKLKFLDLTGTEDLSEIPPGVIANLSELQVLKLAYSGFKDWGLKEEDGDGDGGLSLGELDRLKQLQEVTLTISTSLALEELLCKRRLRRSCTLLELESCANLKSISLLPPSSTTTTSKGGGLGKLVSLKHLRIHSCVELKELILFINDEPISNNNNMLEKLYLCNLPELNNIVWGEKYHPYPAAAQQQQHLASPFQNLYLITIRSCNALKDLTWVVYVESLKFLDVHNCKGIETIIELGDDDGLEEGASGRGCRVFRRLEILKMFGLPNLKSICSHALVFPSIQNIRVYRCPKLKKLPLDSRSNINNTLQEIVGEEEWWSELQWGEDVKSKFLPYFRKIGTHEELLLLDGFHGLLECKLHRGEEGEEDLRRHHALIGTHEDLRRYNRYNALDGTQELLLLDGGLLESKLQENDIRRYYALRRYKNDDVEDPGTAWTM